MINTEADKLPEIDVSETVKSVISPINLVSAYFLRPNIWRTRDGITVPLLKSNYKQFFDNKPSLKSLKGMTAIPKAISKLFTGSELRVFDQKYFLSKESKMLARWSFRALRGFSYLNMASLALTLTQSIGVPIGHMLVNQTGRFLQTLEDKMMPECGGKLQMSYLSKNSNTERKRAIQAMNAQGISGKSAWGSEAKSVASY